MLVYLPRHFYKIYINLHEKILTDFTVVFVNTLNFIENKFFFIPLFQEF